MVRYTKEELVKMVQEHSKILGRTPKMKEVAKNENFPSMNLFLREFETWNNLLKKCNLKLNSVRYYSKEHLLNVLKLLSNRIGRTSRIEDLNGDKDLPSPKVYFEKFGSWNNALKLAGLEINLRRDYTKEELIDSLLKKAKELNQNPTSNDLGRKNNMPDRSTFDDRFGTWNNALKEAGLKINCYYRKWTKEEVIKWLQYKYKELGRTPGIRDFDKDPRSPAKNTVRKLFGNWTNAIREAKIPVRKYHSKDELIQYLQKLAHKLNRTPTREDLKSDKCCPSLTPFVEKFKGYTSACLRAGLVPNDGRNNKIWQGWQKHCERMARVIYGKIEVQKKGIVDGFPDVYIPNENLFIDAKTCSYRDFKEQIKRYCSNGHRLEFWLIFKGIETKRKKVKYVYAEELAEKMKKSGRGDLSAKCHQFIRNVFDEGQRVLG